MQVERSMNSLGVCLQALLSCVDSMKTSFLYMLMVTPIINMVGGQTNLIQNQHVTDLISKLFLTSIVF